MKINSEANFEDALYLKCFYFRYDGLFVDVFNVYPQKSEVTRVSFASSVLAYHACSLTSIIEIRYDSNDRACV